MILESDGAKHVVRAERILGYVLDKRHILEHRERRNEIVRLKYEAYGRCAIVGKLVAAERLDILSVDDYRAACRAVKTAYHVQQRALARAGRSEYNDKFALVNFEIDRVERALLVFTL